MQKGFVHLALIVGIVIAVLAVGGYLFWQSVNTIPSNVLPNQYQKKACTLEAKICPDGTSVGRTGPNCEFAACPNAKSPPIDTSIGSVNLATPKPTASAEDIKSLKAFLAKFDPQITTSNYTKFIELDESSITCEDEHMNMASDKICEGAAKGQVRPAYEYALDNSEGFLVSKEEITKSLGDFVSKNGPLTDKSNEDDRSLYYESSKNSSYIRLVVSKKDQWELDGIVYSRDGSE